MASSVSGQDEPNRPMCLATQVGQMEPSCPLRTICLSCKKKFPESHIINSLLTKFVRSRWLDIGLILFLRVYGPRQNTKKNLANIQPLLIFNISPAGYTRRTFITLKISAISDFRTGHTCDFKLDSDLFFDEISRGECCNFSGGACPQTPLGARARFCEHHLKGRHKRGD